MEEGIYLSSTSISISITIKQPPPYTPNRSPRSARGHKGVKPHSVLRVDEGQQLSKKEQVELVLLEEEEKVFLNALVIWLEIFPPSPKLYSLQKCVSYTHRDTHLLQLQQREMETSPT